MGPLDEPAVRRHLMWLSVAAAGLAILGAVVAMFAIADTLESRRFERNAIHARAEVLRTHTDEFGDCTAADIHFTPMNGTDIRKRVEVWDCSAMSAGSTVSVRYSPTNPDDVRIEASDAWIGLLVAPALALLGLVPWGLRRRARRRFEHLAALRGTPRMMHALTWLSSTGHGKPWISIFEGSSDSEPPVLSYRFFPQEGMLVPTAFVGEVTGDLEGTVVVRDGIATYWPRARPVRRERWKRASRDRADARATIGEMADELAGIERPLLHDRDPGWRPAWRALAHIVRPGGQRREQVSHLEMIRAWYLGSMVSWVFAPLQYLEGGLRLSRPRPSIQLAVGTAGAVALAIGAVIRKHPLRTDAGAALGTSYQNGVMARLATCYLPAAALAVAFFTDRVDFASLTIGVLSWALAFRLAAPTTRDIAEMQARLDAEGVPLSLLTELLRRPPTMPT